MELLSRRDLHTVLQSIRLLRTDHTLETLCARIGAAITHAVRSELTCIDNFHAPAGLWSGHRWAEPEDSITESNMQVFASHLPEHPLYTDARQTGLREPCKISDFVSMRQFQRLGIYTEFFRRVGVDRQLAIALQVSKKTVPILALNRVGRDFSEIDRQKLALLKEHLLTACLDAERLQRLHQGRIDQRYLELALEKREGEVILLGNSGRIRVITERGRKWLARYFAVSPCRTRYLPAELERWVRIQQPFGIVNDTLPQPSRLLRKRCEDSELLVSLIADSSKEANILLLEEKPAGGMPNDNSCTVYGSISCREILDLFDVLTNSEARVLAELLKGKTNKEIAIGCGLSVETARTHLNNIYPKLNVHSRAETAVRILEVLHLRRLGEVPS